MTLDPEMQTAAARAPGVRAAPPTTYDVLLVGDYWYDLIFTDLPRLPALGDEIYAASFDSVPGGPFINAVALKRVGLRVGWAADFGTDPFSRMALEAAQREGLDPALFRHHARPYRRVSVSASFTTDRAFLSYTDPAPCFSATLRALARVTARAVFIPGLFFGPLFDKGQARLRARQMKIVMDCQFTTQRLTEPAVRRALERVDVFMPNASEARTLTGAETTLDALRRLSEVCQLVVVKDGPNGAYAVCGSEVVHAPAIPVGVVDTTGAGDAFSAGFLRPWLEGRPLLECLRWGNVCGGLSTTARGGATAAPTAEQVQAWLARLGWHTDSPNHSPTEHDAG